MIDKTKGRYHLICDICGEAAEEVFSTFDEAVDYKVEENILEAEVIEESGEVTET